MIIKFDKLIYDKKIIYTGYKVWIEYLKNSTINEDKKFITISLDKTNNINEICTEFTNYILDMSSSEELQK